MNPSMTSVEDRPARQGQYGLASSIGIWALAALPMAILSWVVFPRLAPDSSADPLGAGVTRLVLLTLGLVWLFVLSMIIVRQEEGDLRWPTVKRRLRLNAPRDPRTGEARLRLWLWLIPFLLAIAAVDLGLAPYLNRAWVSVFPFLAEPAGWSFGSIFESPEIRQRLVGAWWFLALYVVSALFNTLLGEEFLFRGVLLPRMEGRFGSWAWIPNAVLFGGYHLHQPWGILSSIVGGFLYAYPSQRFRTTWMGVVVHSGQSVYLSFLILGLVLGKA